jgi:hypothetical protein
MTDDETSTGVIVNARTQLSDCEICVRSAHFAVVRSAAVPASSASVTVRDAAPKLVAAVAELPPD